MGKIRLSLRGVLGIIAILGFKMPSSLKERKNPYRLLPVIPCNMKAVLKNGSPGRAPQGMSLSLRYLNPMKEGS